MIRPSVEGQDPPIKVGKRQLLSATIDIDVRTYFAEQLKVVLQAKVR